MERGVLWGGLLISGSFLLAVTLHQAAKEPPAPVRAEHADVTSEDGDRPCGSAGSIARGRPGVRRSSDCERERVPRKSPD
jgi:hypothetical protein